MDVTTVGILTAIVVPMGAAIGKGVSWAINLTAKFEAHEIHDAERFKEQQEMLKEIRTDVKELLKHSSQEGKNET